jgi:hypothetical protein
MTPQDTELMVATDHPDSARDADRDVSSTRDRREAGQLRRSQGPDPDQDPNAPDRTARLYVGLWLPAAGALLAYAVMRGNYWAAFIGVELLLVGWFTLGKL